MTEFCLSSDCFGTAVAALRGEAAKNCGSQERTGTEGSGKKVWG